MPDKVFLDTNVLIYLLASTISRVSVVEQLLRQKPFISVQVLNEITNVACRKLDMTWSEINTFLTNIRVFCAPVSLTAETHDRARLLAERYGFEFYDAVIVAAALLEGCTILYTEDMHSGLMVDGVLTLRNPFHHYG